MVSHRAALLHFVHCRSCMRRFVEVIFEIADDPRLELHLDPLVSSVIDVAELCAEKEGV